MKDKVQQELTLLFAKYKKNLPEKINSLQMKWQMLCEHHDEKTLEDLHREVHSLSGSSSTYGYTELSKISHELESFLNKLMEKSSFSEQDQEEINKLLNRLKNSVLDAEAVDFLAKVYTPQKNKLVYVLDNDHDFMIELHEQMSPMGYELKQLSSMKELLKLLDRQWPMALVVNVDFLDKKDSEAFLALKSQKGLSIPLFCVSAVGDMETRLRAMRAGSSAFFLKPIDTFYLMKTLDQICNADTNEPFRILIVDDVSSLGEYYSLILQDNGMVTRVIADPMKTIEAIIEFRPDLLLLDVYMPRCSGIELAAILRQEPKYMHIPIIFLSSEEDRFKQLAALTLGGDDFLTKPVLPQHLITAVNLRAKRAGILTSYIMRDSLTGLWNHSNILRQLDIELIRAERHHSVFTFVMLDVDHFKLINDRYGHVVGDRVLKKLAELLTSRVRRTDQVGRYGGEEFAIILPNTKANEAKVLFESLLQQFSEMRFLVDDSDFTVSFSVGIAESFRGIALHQLVEAADQALYQAKQSGRNRIVCSHIGQITP